MRIVVASGKGGVGKSMLASALAMLYAKENKVVACDCDADAPNLGLWLGVEDYDSVEKVSTSSRAVIDYGKCVNCGKCAETCRFNAIKMQEGKPVANYFLCEGCGACELVCPQKAITMKSVQNGAVRVRRNASGIPLYSGQLFPGETGSGKIVEEIRKRAEKEEHEVMVLDAAAGIGCPVIASVRGCDRAVLVTEPTPSGLADLKRALTLVEHFNLPYQLVVNKWDANKETTAAIEEEFGEKVIGKLSYDRKVIDSIVRLKPILESDSKVVGEIKAVFQRLQSP